MCVRGVRGAITTEQDEPESILAATRQLLLAMLEANPGMEPGDIASALFTVTEDLTSAYPATAARAIGWSAVPLMCAREIPVPGSMPRCIRILLHWNTPLAQQQIRHVYLGAATRLRPDLNLNGG